ncbi:MAG TPA: hypothetical protein VM938_05330 [Acidimicrobiales bacterium]|nr:hypothetical protein [Acidimicrobiales bacterium]
MRRSLVLALAVGLAAVPAVGSAAGPSPNLTLLSPSADSVAARVVEVRWSYAGFHRTTPVDVEVRRGTDAFTRVGRVPIDDGTPGYYGSLSWSTGDFDDGTDYTVRVIAPTNKRVSSSASPVSVDNSGPTTTITVPDPPVSVLADVTGTAVDAVSAVSTVTVQFVAPDGSRTQRVASCTGCGTSTSVTWAASTAGLAPASYEVRAWAVDMVGNVGPTATATMAIVGTPSPPEVTPPEVTPPEVTVPDATVPEPTVPEPTVPDGVPPTVPTDPASTVPPVTVPVAVPTL